MSIATEFMSISEFFLIRPPPFLFFFFFNDTATTEIYTLSLHDALPIFDDARVILTTGKVLFIGSRILNAAGGQFKLWQGRSEEHTSELQSRLHLVCRLLLEKKKQHVFVMSVVSYPYVLVDNAVTDR